MRGQLSCDSIVRGRLPVAALCALLLSLPLAYSATAQEISRVEIRKAMPQVGASGQTAVEIYLFMDIQGLNLENPIDLALTRLETFVDDRGTDLLAQHKIHQRKNEERGFPAPDPIAFTGVGDWQNDKDIKLGISVIDTPSSGATRLRLTGEVVLNFAAEVDVSSVLVVEIPVDMGYDSRGIDSAIGKLLIQEGGSASSNDVTWYKFLVSSADSAIVEVSVVGGDDSGEVPFMGVEANAFVFREPPATVALNIRYQGQKKVHVPLDMSISLGL